MSLVEKEVVTEKALRNRGEDICDFQHCRWDNCKEGTLEDLKVGKLASN
jgi:hypothetical protein